MKKIVLFLLIIIAFAACKKDDIPPKTIWFENIGSRTDLPFLPDGNVNYYLFSFKRKPGDKIGIRMKGDFPYARYMSYNVYDNRDRSSQASVVDVDIIADEGNSNPFTTGTQSSNRGYTLYVLPDIPEAAGYKNALKYDDQTPNVGTMIRLYVPEIDQRGGVALPEVEAFDMVTGKTVKLPEPLPIDFSRFSENEAAFRNVIGLTALLQEIGKVDFFRFSGAGLYENFDNLYLFAPVVLGRNEVVVLKVKPPGSARNLSDIPTADTRYYSFCLGDFSTYNYFTYADFQCKVASDGFIYLVVGRDDPVLKQRAEGLNYLVWDERMRDRGLILYRNLLTHPEYPYNMRLVPDLVENLNQVFNTDFIRAKTYLGDRSPTGIKMSREAYLENFGGFQVAY